MARISNVPVFRRRHRGDKVGRPRLTAPSVALALKEHSGKVGLEAGRYAGHSLHSGFLTSAARNRASTFKMANQSRHNSLDVLRAYVRNEERFEDHAADGLLQRNAPNRSCRAPPFDTVIDPTQARVARMSQAVSRIIHPRSPDSLTTMIWPDSSPSRTRRKNGRLPSRGAGRPGSCYSRILRHSSISPVPRRRRLIPSRHTSYGQALRPRDSRSLRFPANEAQRLKAPQLREYVAPRHHALLLATPCYSPHCGRRGADAG